MNAPVLFVFIVQLVPVPSWYRYKVTLKVKRNILTEFSVRAAVHSNSYESRPRVEFSS